MKMEAEEVVKCVEKLKEYETEIESISTSLQDVMCESKPNEQICRNSGYLATSCQAGPNVFHSSRQFLPRFTHKMSRNSYFSCFEVIYRN